MALGESPRSRAMRPSKRPRLDPRANPRFKPKRLFAAELDRRARAKQEEAARAASAERADLQRGAMALALSKSGRHDMLASQSSTFPTSITTNHDHDTDDIPLSNNIPPHHHDHRNPTHATSGTRSTTSNALGTIRKPSSFLPTTHRGRTTTAFPRQVTSSSSVVAPDAAQAKPAAPPRTSGSSKDSQTCLSAWFPAVSHNPNPTKPPVQTVGSHPRPSGGASGRKGWSVYSDAHPATVAPRPEHRIALE